MRQDIYLPASTTKLSYGSLKGALNACNRRERFSDSPRASLSTVRGIIPGEFRDGQSIIRTHCFKLVRLLGGSPYGVQVLLRQTALLQQELHNDLDLRQNEQVLSSAMPTPPKWRLELCATKIPRQPLVLMDLVASVPNQPNGHPPRSTRKWNFTCTLVNR
jgi:hypothetical protein